MKNSFRGTLCTLAMALTTQLPLAKAVNVAPQGTGIIGVNDSTNFTDLGTPLAHAGAASNVNDNTTNSRSDTFGTNAFNLSYVGVIWSAPRVDAVKTLTLTMATFFDGGWFGPNAIGPGAGGALTSPTYLTAPVVQVTTDGGTTWATIAHTSNYLTEFEGHTIGGGGNPNPTSKAATFTLTTPQTGINGIRIIGFNGGTADGNGFIGVFEFEADAVPANDVDTDGMDDNWERAHGLIVGVNDSAGDPDADGLSNLDEFTRNTDPKDSDSDNDNLNDGDEVLVYLTNPLSPDTDADGLNDGAEVSTYSTNPKLPDTDGDGLNDGAEVLTYMTNPSSVDSDSDGFGDGVEVQSGSNPNNVNSIPANVALAGNAIIGTNDGTNTGFLGTPWNQAGAVTNINDGNLTTRTDTFGRTDPLAYVGIIWSAPRVPAITRLELTMATFFDGGWFGPNGTGPGAGGTLTPAYLTEPDVQISTDGGGTWTTVPHTSDYLTVFNGHGIGGGGNPNPSSKTATFTLTTAAQNITGIRLIGSEGGTASGGFIGAFELVVKDTNSSTDLDGDGLSNDQETNTYGTNPNNPDTDGDGLTDGQEVLTYTTNPLVKDTDGDEFSDGIEVAAGTNPKNASSFPPNFALVGTAVIGTDDAVDSDAGNPQANAGGAANVNDNNATTRVDTYNAGAANAADTASFVGIRWNSPRTVPITELNLTHAIFFDGGWFGVSGITPGSGNLLSAAANLIEPDVQVTSDGGATWTTVPHTSNYLVVLDGHPLPSVDFGPPTAVTAKFRLNTPQTGINGIRIIGLEGGTASGGFLGVFELQAIGSSTPNPDGDNDGLPDAWEMSNFGSTAGHSAADDKDRDGLTELEEYGFARNPNTPDAGAQPPVTVVNGFLTVTIAKQPGVTYLVQSTGSLDPASWSASTTTTLVDNATTLTVRDNVSVLSGENRFLRVRVVAP